MFPGLAREVPEERLTQWMGFSPEPARFCCP